MPYIIPEKRIWFENNIRELVKKLKQDPKNVEGNLNYIISKMILLLNPKNYKEMNALIGALECCKLELYRKLISPYEDKKIIENKDLLAPLENI